MTQMITNQVRKTLLKTAKWHVATPIVRPLENHDDSIGYHAKSSSKREYIPDCSGYPSDRSNEEQINLWLPDEYSMQTGQQDAHRNENMSTSSPSEEDPDGDRTPENNLKKLLDEGRSIYLGEWVEDEEMEDVIYLLECLISEDVDSNLQRGHDGVHNDDVVGEFIVSDDITSNYIN